MPDKCVVILLDGLGDRACSELNGQTPLQAACTPVLDRLAGIGGNGLYHAGCIGQALPSENAHFAMFGYGADDFPGRGALEALGAGMALAADEVALLAHFAALREESGCLVLHQDVPRISSDDVQLLSRKIALYRSGDITLRYVQNKGVFGILTMQGHVSPLITDSNTMIEGLPLPRIRPWQEAAFDSAACSTADALEAYLLWVYRQLNDHPVNRARRAEGEVPVNGLITQRAGRLKPVTPFLEQNGLRALSIASGQIYWGIGAFLGMDVCKVHDRGEPEPEIALRLRMALDALDQYDFMHVHTKAADEAAHKKDPLLKVRVIEALDRGIGQVVNSFLERPDVLLIVTADHSTPSCGKLIHSGEPVPLAIVGEGVRKDQVCRFDEVSAATGSLGCVRGGEFMRLILNYLDLARLEGVRDAPGGRDFWPGHYEGLRITGGSDEL